MRSQLRKSGAVPCSEGSLGHRRFTSICLLLIPMYFYAVPILAAGACTESPLRVTGGVAGNRPDFIGPRDNCGAAHCLAPALSPYFAVSQPTCDLWGTAACTIHVGVKALVPENRYRAATLTTQRTFWFYGDTPPTSCNIISGCYPAAYCGEWQAGQQLAEDQADSWVEVGFTCTNPAATPTAVYSVLTSGCYLQGSCERSRSQVITVSPTTLRLALCRPPRKDTCTTGDSCRECSGPGGGVGIGGDGPGFGGGGGKGDGETGPGARLRYLARGTGSPTTPGYLSWRGSLGRNWSHDYAERIVFDPAITPPTHVWLLTRYASFEEFQSLDATGNYQVRSPLDEYRTLRWLGAGNGWELRDLDGTVDSFDASGRWSSTRDRNNNQKIGTYSGTGLLGSVSMPDGRSETFAYSDDGKLASITEVGIDPDPSDTVPAPTRAWYYWWAGDDLYQINRPDGTALRFEYTDSRHPGYLTRVVLVGIDTTPNSNPLAPERTLRAYSYDDYGNVIQAWTGSTSFSTGAEKYAFAYDNPESPTQTTVTTEIDNSALRTEVTTFSFEREVNSSKIRLRSVSGSCPSCGFASNSQFFYESVEHWHKPTRIEEPYGAGTVQTLLAYGPQGQLTRRVEAANNPDANPDLPRETTWEYMRADFPALPTAIIGPTTENVPATRRTDFVYDSNGNLSTRTLSGLEATYDADGSFTPLTTTYSNYNAAGRVGAINPPGYLDQDVSTLTYASPNRNGLFPDSRTDPLVGTTTFEYTPFNEAMSVTDPNNMRTGYVYDGLGRITSVTTRGDDNGTPVDLVTSYYYNVFGYLVCVKRPRGNGIQFVYDGTGRLTAEVRGTAVAAPDGLTEVCLETNQLRERRLWTLDTFGHRKREALQRTTTATWPTTSSSETSWVYASRCQLEQTINDAAGTIPKVTEYGYDCRGGLEKIWDANHPRATYPTQPTAEYGHDALNRLLSVTQPWGGEGAGSVATIYRYDLQDHLTKVIDGEGSETDYEYSDRDLLTAQTSPVSGASTNRYNEHGVLAETIDARNVSTVRTIDAADRLEAISYPDAGISVDYQYGSDPVAHNLGRLVNITRAGNSVAYTYDEFGRPTTEGNLTFTHDANGNVQTIGYPGNLLATYSYDAMDRQRSLAVQEGGGPSTTVVSSTVPAQYLPFGPLTSLRFGSTPTVRDETRTFDGRYGPASIVVSGGALSMTYKKDAIGNIWGITAAPTSLNRDFGYQDWQYYLTCAIGPWVAGRSPSCGPVSGTPSQWVYDKAGNRIREVVQGQTLHYSYQPNSANGHTATLSNLKLNKAGPHKWFTFDSAGNLAQSVDYHTGVTSTYSTDAAGHLAGLNAGRGQLGFRYDGRGFLVQALSGATTFLEPTYDSQGRLFSTLRNPMDSNPATRTNLLYLAGRPVAQWKKVGTSTATLEFITTDHLGTPIVSFTSTGAVRWSGGFEPFGRDWQAGTPTGALENGLFLRLPGQIDDPLWRGIQPPIAPLAADLYYNVHRWYEPQTGRYTSVDPLGSQVDSRSEPLTEAFAYAGSRPTRLFDTLGLFTMDDSCNCLSGLPSGRDKPSRDRYAFLVGSIGKACGELLSGISDVPLRRCIGGSCDHGEVFCDSNCPSGRLGGITDTVAAGVLNRFGGAIRTAKLCVNNWRDLSAAGAGPVAIHEWAHGCAWLHGEGTGVPGPNGKF